MSIRFQNKYGDSGHINELPTRKELEQRTIPQLICICTARRYNRKPFKQDLIDYILDLGKLNI